VFFPGSNDPARLDFAMRASLAESLSYIQSVVGSDLDISESEVAITAERIRQRRIEPGAFGRYYKLVLAIESGRHDEARQIFRQIMSIANREPTFTVMGFTDKELGDEKQLYSDLINQDPTGLPWMAPPNTEIDFRDNVLKSFELLDIADKALTQELRGLIIQVVGASPSLEPGVRAFGSASSFMLWGSIFFNVERHQRVLDIIQAIVHESAHLLLYAHSIEEPFVTNPIDARYSSPLRSDPRPMDGVFHATFVTARMHYANQKLRQAMVSFSSSELNELDERLVTLRDLYFGGLQTVEQYGLLTPTGARIIHETREYMKAV
jgi:hypothetical protein